MNYKKINNLTGWGIFAVAMYVYWATAERTASFWDCGEFIAVARYLQTPHPPGAPIFSLLGRLFSLLGGDGILEPGVAEGSTTAAFWVNMMSAVSGAFTVLFLFWSVTIIAKKLLNVDGEPSKAETLVIMGAGIVAGLACTFCDSIWFSAVEAEVYAISLFFTSFVFWAMLKWDENANDPQSDRWLMLVAYGVGLSIGVHLLNLVTIPAMGLIFYFRKYKPDWVKASVAVLISGIILFVILSSLPWISDLAFGFDRIFVGMGLPFNVGAYILLTLLVGALVFGVYKSIINNNRVLNVSLLSGIFILIGFMSYGVIIIRSGQNPPIDENNPENLVNFISYLKREQYGDRPLFNGPQFNMASDYTIEPGKKRYKKDKNGYRMYHQESKVVYPAKAKSFLPRMYSTDQRHLREYRQLLKNYLDDDRQVRKILAGKEKISFWTNMQYMFDRQLGRMYLRYFKWNFIGRARQKQYAESLTPFATANEDLPKLLQHPSRNNFFAIPFIIGLIGLLFQFSKDYKNFSVVAMLFFFTGIAIIIYLNAPPIEPRERDYAYAGSYFAFTIWMGLGVVALYSMINKVLSNKMASAAIGLAVCMVAPTIMGAVGWDDHDRSRRYFSVDGAKNLLESCAPNAILFTAGDNDTFPLWYVQEVEGFRNDVRVCNLSLLGTDWYIESMKRKAHNSEALPISFEHKDFIQGKNDYLRYYPQYDLNKNAYQLEPEVKYLSQKDPGYLLDKFISDVKAKNANASIQNGRQKLEAKRVRKFIVPLDATKIAQQDFIPEKYKNRIPERMVFDNGNRGITKSDLMMLDMINQNAKNGWKRPIYFSTTIGNPGGNNFQGIKKYLQLEGLAYRLVPFVGNGEINEEIMVTNMTEKFSYRGLNDNTICYTDDYERMVLGLKGQFLQLASHFNYKGDKKKAQEILEFYDANISEEVFPWTVYGPSYLNVVYTSYGVEKGNQEAEKLFMQNLDVLKFYAEHLTGNDAEHLADYSSTSLRVIQSVSMLIKENDQQDTLKHLFDEWEQFTSNPNNREYLSLISSL